MKSTPRHLLSWAMLAAPLAFFAQPDVALLRQLSEENKKSVEALVLYPSETRLAILEATKRPEALIKMQDMRQKTTAAFRDLIDDFPRAAQSVFYDINRYPGLVGELAASRGDAAVVHRLLEILPEDQREEAFGVVSRQFPTVGKIDELNATTGRAFERMIADYPAQARAAFKTLLGLPEVIDLLNQDLRFTILVGDTYRDSPAWVVEKTDSLNLAVARAHAEELENWKKNLDGDPEAKAELESAARDYTKEKAYDSEYYDGDDFYDHDHRLAESCYFHPYPYWFGYPYWEPYPRWHPYPWWWDWGGYFEPGGGFVVVWMPSYYFMNWYFWEPWHHEHYCHLSAQFVNHYHGHRRSGTPVVAGVREWHEGNRAVISEEFLADKNRMPERMKEFGEFEVKRDRYNDNHPKSPASQTDFLDKNHRKFPDLERSRQAAKTEASEQNKAGAAKRADWAPPKPPTQPEPSREPKAEKPSRRETSPPQKPTQPAPIPKTDRPAPAPRPKTQQQEDARDYQQRKMEETRPRPQAPRTQQAPAPKTEKAPTGKPRKAG